MLLHFSAADHFSFGYSSKQPHGYYVNVVTYGRTGMIFEATTNAGPGTFTQIQPRVDEIV